MEAFLSVAILTALICIHVEATIPVSDLDKVRLGIMSGCYLSPLASAPNEFDPSKPTTTGVFLAMDQFKDIDDLEQTISMIATLMVTFQVDCVATKTKEANRTSSMPIAPYWNFYSGFDLLWKPPIVHKNSRSDYAMQSSIATNIAVNSFLGSLTYSYTGLYTAECSLNLQKFPFDEQHCTFEYAIFVANNSITVGMPQWAFMDEEHFQKKNSGWQITSISTDLSNPSIGEYNYFVATFRFHLKRRLNYFLFNIIIPSSILSIVQISTFFIHFGSEDRAIFSITILLAFSVAQASVVENIPKTSEDLYLMKIVSGNMMSSLAVTFYATITCAIGDSFAKTVERKFGCCEIRLSRLLDLCAALILTGALAVVNTVYFSLLMS